MKFFRKKKPRASTMDHIITPEMEKRQNELEQHLTNIAKENTTRSSRSNLYRKNFEGEHGEMLRHDMDSIYGGKSENFESQHREQTRDDNDSIYGKKSENFEGRRPKTHREQAMDD